MRADVNDGVGTKLPRKPLVGGQVLVGRRYFRIMEDLTDPAVTASSGTAAFGLHAHHRIAEIHPRDQEFALVEHCGWNAVPFLARRLTPGLDHAKAGGLGQFFKPGQVALFIQRDQRPSFHGDFIGGGPPEFGKGLTAENGINDGFAVFRWCHQIACLFHPFEDVGHAFEGIKMSASAHGGFHRSAGVVVQDEGNLLVAVGLARERHPAGHAGGQAFHAVGDGSVGFFFRIAEAARRSHDERLDNPLKLGQRHAPRHLLAQSLRVFQPGLLVFVVGNDRTHERHVEPTKQACPRFRLRVAQVVPLLPEKEDGELDEGFHQRGLVALYQEFADGFLTAQVAQVLVLQGVEEDRHNPHVPVFQGRNEGFFDLEVAGHPVGSRAKDPNQRAVSMRIAVEEIRGIGKWTAPLGVKDPLPYGFLGRLERHPRGKERRCQELQHLLEILDPVIEKVAIRRADDFRAYRRESPVRGIRPHHHQGNPAP